MLTQEELKEQFHYSPATGEFTRLPYMDKRYRIRYGDKKVGTVNKNRLIISINHKRYMAHRLAWLYIYGKWPDYQIDHIDGNPLNNKIDNLRDVIQDINMQNLRKPPSHNKTGYIGSSWCKKKLRYVSRITVNKKHLHLGYFNNAISAHNAYLSAKRKYHEGCTI